MDVTWKERIKSWLVPTPAGARLAPSVAAGMYHYQHERDGEYIRFHLRVEPHGEALLIAGASEVARLSPAGATAAKALLESNDRDSLVAGVHSPAVQQLYRDVDLLLDELGGGSSRFPIFNLPDPLENARDTERIAPFQADMEIGDLSKLQAILRRLWDAGVPHVRLLHDVAVDSPQLVQAVEYAEDIGMITGVRALAGWLADDDRIERLADVGLDYAICPWLVRNALHDELDLQVYVQPDASARLEYRLVFTNQPNADAIDIVDIGLPHSEYRINEMSAALNGTPLRTIRKSKYVDIGVEVPTRKCQVPQSRPVWRR